MQHLQNNADDKLDSMVGSRSNVRRAVHSALFVSAGLTSCNDIITFDNKVTEVRKDVLPICHRHRRRSNSISRDYLHSLLRDNVVAGRPRSTNNNCESVNPIIKQYTQWRPQQLPDLINKLRNLVRGQYIEADRVLSGRGDLQLVPAYVKHRVTVDMWKSLSAAQR